ncbi:nucleotidyltransferase family protein [uncultured Sanguibacteroides sp.]|uniref:nucleotidyltransferase family protein n=1 Tax=uncultured Sanguibacteroides sp. TaxID=1635151 RepID=UPI0025EFA08D|nr:nucleotidyltransferase family protein [uncultured Sanguibacteroides sp.]
MNYKEKISNKIVQVTQSIIRALKIMDAQKVKLLYVYDNDVFVSILTIGDIQRAIIANVDLNASIRGILDFDKKYASPSDSLEDIKQKMLSLKAESMPVLNEDNELVDVYLWEDFFDNQEKRERRKLSLPVVIMAGGKGIRLQPLTNIIPKPLIPIGEKTIVETILDQFESIGCDQFYMSVNYKSEVLEYYFDHLTRKYDITFFKEDKPLGTIGSVTLLKNKISTPFFVSNCDILIDQDFIEVYDYHVVNKNDLTIITSVKSYQIPYGVIQTGEDGIMEGLSEKPEMTYMINTGVYIIQPELINEIPENQFFHITELMEKVKQRGGKIGCFPVSEKSWTDIGDWKEYLRIINK